MRSYDPTDEDDMAEAAKLKAEPWMLNLLQLNPGYVHWGPHEDCMWNTGDGWSGRILNERWEEGFALDDMNEVVNFYFFVNRESRECTACGGSGYNPATHVIAESFYRHSSPTGEGWNDKITQDEVQALVDAGRLEGLTQTWTAGEGWKRDARPVPTAEQVNAAQHKGGFNGSHDAINRYILIEARAKRLGVFGHCPECKGEGYLYTRDFARVGLTLWVLHPRKGASRGVEYADIHQEEVPKVLAYLRQAAERNAERFSKVTKL